MMKHTIFCAKGNTSPSEQHEYVLRPVTILALACLFALSLNSTSWATNITWIGGNGLGGNGGFDTAIDWNPNQIPGSSDTAIFNDTPGVIYTIGLNVSNEVVGSVSVSNSLYSLSWLANTNTLTILNSLLIDAGTGNTPQLDSLNNGIFAATNASGTAVFQVGNAADSGLGNFEMQHQYSAGLSTGDTSITNYPTLIANNFVVVNNSTFSFTAGTLTTAGSSITAAGVFTGLSPAVGDISTWNMHGTNVISAGAQVELAQAATNAIMNVNVTGPNTLWKVAGTELDIGYNGTANLVISGGAVVTNAGLAYLSRNSTLSNSNTVTVTGAGSVWNVGGELFVGDAAAYNVVTVANGGFLSSFTGRIGGGSSLGDSNNTVIVTGSGSQWNIATALYIGNGNDANCSLIVSNGGVVNAGSITRLGTQLNFSYNDSLFVDGSGSQLIGTIGNMTVGNFGFGAAATVKNGGLIHTAGVTIGAGVGSSNNTVLVTGTNSLWIANGAVSVGVQDTGNVVIVTNAGELLGYTGLDDSPSIASGNSVLVSGGTVIMTNALTNAFIRVGFSNQQGTFTFNGGTISVDNLLLTNGAASIFAFNSGVLNVKNGTVNNGAAFAVGSGSSAATLNLQGLTTAYSNGLNISSAAILMGSGTVNGNITLANGATLAPGSGATVGTLTVNGSLALANSSVSEYYLGSSSDEIIVNGSLTIAGTLDIFNSGGFGAGIYPLFTYTGTLVNNGLTVGTTPSPSFQYSIDTTSQVGVVNLDVTGGSSNPFTTWQNHYFGCTGCPQAQPNADPDGNGISNTNKFLTGFNPTNSAAYPHIISIVRTNNNTDIRVTYLAASGDSTYTGGPASRTNVLEFTTGTANGSYSTNSFTSTGQTNIFSGGTGLGAVTTVVDSGGATNKPSRFYRVEVLLP
jgi:fibronectin-binding autotransporter adhesin